MKEFHQTNNKTAFATGKGYELNELKSLIHSRKVKSWQLEYETESSSSPEQIKMTRNDGSNILSYHEYQSFIQNKKEYDFIYDSVIERFYIKDRRSIPAGAYELGSEILKYLASASYPISSDDLANELMLRNNYSGALIRQAIKRIRDKTLTDLILYVDKRGYLLNPQINWVIIERAINEDNLD